MLESAAYRGITNLLASEAQFADVIHAAAFFNWANRLMLSLGEPAAAESST